MKNLRYLVFITVLSVFFIGIQSAAQAGIPSPSLYDLQVGNVTSIMAGNLLFDQWSVGIDGIPDGDRLPDVDGMTEVIPNLADILVIPLNDGGLDPGPGLRFSAGNAALDVSSGEYIHLLFGFRVSTIDDLLIKDNSLAITDAFITNLNFNGMSIAENIFDAAGNSIGDKYVEFAFMDDVILNITDSASFSPTNMIYVTKEILLWAYESPGLTASLTGFNQRFSQTAPVPEPATMLLLGTGLVGVAGAARRKRNK